MSVSDKLSSHGLHTFWTCSSSPCPSSSLPNRLHLQSIRFRVRSSSSPIRLQQPKPETYTERDKNSRVYNGDVARKQTANVYREEEEYDDDANDDDEKEEDDHVVDEDFSAQEEAMLVALQNRKTHEAWRNFEFFVKMKHIPSKVCLSRLVAQLSHEGSPSSLTKAQRVLAYLQKREQASLLDCNCLGLLAMATSKAGATRYAASVVRLMLRLGYFPHVKAWSAVVSKLGRNREDVALALDLFDEVCSVVKGADACNGKMTEDGTDSGAMRPDTGAFNAALNACANACLVDKAKEVVKSIYAFGLKPDVLTFNILIKLYGLADDREKLAVIFDAMEAAGVKPASSTMHSLVAALVGLDELERAVMLVESLKTGKGDIRNILVSLKESSGLESSNNLDGDADQDLNKAESSSLLLAQANAVNENDLMEFSFKPDTRMYTILMKGYMQKGKLNDVMQILNAMQNLEETNEKPNEVTYTTAISTCVRLDMLDEARNILLQMAAEKVPVNTVTYNVLLKGYCDVAQVPKGRLLFEDMIKAGVKPDVVSYNTLINGYISIDDNASALTMFTKMRNAGIAPSKVSYTTLIKAFGNSGQPQLAAKVFNEMEQDRRVRVDVIAWNTLIECYSKAGNVEGAKESFQRMKNAGQVPTVATYGSLVKAFTIGRKAGEALVLWKEIKERLESKEAGVVPLQPDAGLLDGLVNICVRDAFFLKALEIIACMEKYGIPADRIKYKEMFVELHSKLYTSKYTSQARRDRTADRRRAVEAFKFWVGLPNSYYATFWSS